MTELKPDTSTGDLKQPGLEILHDWRDLRGSPGRFLIARFSQEAVKLEVPAHHAVSVILESHDWEDPGFIYWDSGRYEWKISHDFTEDELVSFTGDCSEWLHIQPGFEGRLRIWPLMWQKQREPA